MCVGCVPHQYCIPDVCPWCWQTVSSCGRFLERSCGMLFRTKDIYLVGQDNSSCPETVNKWLLRKRGVFWNCQLCTFNRIIVCWDYCGAETLVLLFITFSLFASVAALPLNWQFPECTLCPCLWGSSWFLSHPSFPADSHELFKPMVTSSRKPALILWALTSLHAYLYTVVATCAVVCSLSPQLSPLFFLIFLCMVVRTIPSIVDAQNKLR